MMYSKKTSLNKTITQITEYIVSIKKICLKKFIRKNFYFCTYAFILGIMAAGCIIEPETGPKKWELSGKVQTQDDVKIKLKDENIKIAVFSHNAESYFPSIDNIKPVGKPVKVKKDSSFSLTVKTSGINTDFIHAIIWLDVDEDGKLDSKSEPFEALSERTSFGGGKIIYTYDEREESWLSIYDKEKAGSRSDLEVLLGRSLSGSKIKWSISGKLKPAEDFRVAVKDEKVRIGAFDHSSGSLTIDLGSSASEDGFSIIDPENSAVPGGGWAKVKKDSTFKLDIDTEELEHEYLHIILWYDDNKNGEIDAFTEHYSFVYMAQIDGKKKLTYKLNSSTGDWENSITQKNVAEERELNVLVKQNIAPILKAWRLDGKLVSHDDFEYKVSKKAVKVGGFTSGETSFNPDTNGVKPNGGVTTIGKDSSFSMELDMADTKDANLHIIAWYDGNKNDTLDAKDEPFAQLRLYSESSGGRTPLVYKYDSSAREWSNSNSDEPAENLDSMRYTVAKSLVGLKSHWKYSGSLSLKEGFEMDLKSEKIMMGIFGHSSSSYSPDFDEIEPEGGLIKIKKDSKYSIEIDASEASKDYLHMVVWFDINGDSLLDATSEPFAKPYLKSLSETVFLYFNKTSSSGEWHERALDPVVRDTADVELIIDRNLIKPRKKWTLKGKVVPSTDEDIETDSNKVAIGAFSYASTLFNPSVNNIEPEAGMAEVGKDSNFTLKLDAGDIDEKYIHIVVWFDKNENGKLDGIGEKKNSPREAEIFGGQRMYYKYNDKLFQWEVHYDSGPAKSLEDIEVQVDNDIRE